MNTQEVGGVALGRAQRELEKDQLPAHCTSMTRPQCASEASVGWRWMTSATEGLSQLAAAEGTRESKTTPSLSRLESRSAHRVVQRAPVVEPERWRDVGDGNNIGYGSCLAGFRRRRKARHRHQCVALVVGDGVNTYEDSAKRMLRLISSESQTRWCTTVSWFGSLHLTRPTWQSASRSAAACRLTPWTPTTSVALLSRLFKYLIPSCLEEFSAHLRALVLERFTMHHDVGSNIVG